MPYTIEKRDDDFVVVKDDDGSVIGTHPTRRDATRQLKALFAEEGADGQPRKKKEDEHGDE